MNENKVIICSQSLDLEALPRLLQVTQLYVPSARHVWRTRRMGRIGPLQSTLDGNLLIVSRASRTAAAPSCTLGNEQKCGIEYSNACVSVKHHPGNHPNCRPKSPSPCLPLISSDALRSVFPSLRTWTRPSCLPLTCRKGVSV